MKYNRDEMKLREKEHEYVTITVDIPLDLKERKGGYLAEWLGDDVYMKLGGDVFLCHDLISAFQNYYTQFYLKGENQEG